MAVCAVCGKQRVMSMNVSHAHNRTKNVLHPNLQRVRVKLGGGIKRIFACTTCIRSNKIEKA